MSKPLVTQDDNSLVSSAIGVRNQGRFVLSHERGSSPTSSVADCRHFECAFRFPDLQAVDFPAASCDNFFQMADDADRILLVSPVYFYGLSAQCKIFGDRFQARWARRYLLKERFRETEGRKGYLLSTAATKGPKIFDCSILTARYIYDAMDVEYGGEFLVKGVDKRKAVLEVPDEITRAEQFGRDIVEGSI